jgi:hypothetical protein
MGNIYLHFKLHNSPLAPTGPVLVLLEHTPVVDGDFVLDHPGKLL